jgi:hypothetical protein
VRPQPAADERTTCRGWSSDCLPSCRRDGLTRGCSPAGLVVPRRRSASRRPSRRLPVCGREEGRARRRCVSGPVGTPRSRPGARRVPLVERSDHDSPAAVGVLAPSSCRSRRWRGPTTRSRSLPPGRRRPVISTRSFPPGHCRLVIAAWSSPIVTTPGVPSGRGTGPWRLRSGPWHRSGLRRSRHPTTTASRRVRRAWTSSAHGAARGSGPGPAHRARPAATVGRRLVAAGDRPSGAGRPFLQIRTPTGPDRAIADAPVR